MSDDITHKQSCKDRVTRHLQSRLSELRRIRRSSRSNCGDDTPRSFSDYGLSFEYVEPLTFTEQREGYFRYLLSWGGPSDEFRFFVNCDFSCHRVEYWFLDWFDGAHKTLSGGAESLLLDVWDYFRDFAPNFVNG